MSDESTIAASTLLSSLLGATSTTPLQATPTHSESSTESEIDGGSDAFGQLLRSNIDADAASSEAAHSFQPHDLQPDISAPTTELDGIPNEFRPHLPQLALDTPAVALSQTGNDATGTGNSLPIDPVTLESIAHPVTEDVLTTINVSGSLEQVQGESVNAIDAVDSSATQPELSVEDLSVTADDVVVEVSLASPAAAAVPAQVTLSEQNHSRAREVASSVSGLDGNAPEAELDAALADDAGTQQQESNDQDTPEQLFEARNQQRVTAEFALGGPQKHQLQYSASASSGGEFSSVPLSNLNAPAVTSPPVAATSLTLVPDRQLASQQIAQHIASFVRQGDDFVEINLSPPHLGKMSARILMQNDQASVVLTAHSADTRGLIEASLPRLGSLLQDAGLTLADANVFSQDQGDNAETTADANDNRNGNGAEDGNPDTQQSVGAPALQPVMGLLDAYA